MLNYMYTFFQAHVALLPLFGGREMEFFLAVVRQDLFFHQYVHVI